MTENELRQIIGNPKAGDTLALDTTRFHDSVFARQVRTVFGTSAPPIHLDQKPVIFGPFLRLKGSVPLLGVTFTGDLQLDFGSPAPRFKIHLATPAASLRAILDTLLGGRFPLPPLLDVQTEAIDLTLDVVSGQVTLIVRTTSANLGTIAVEAHTRGRRLRIHRRRRRHARRCASHRSSRSSRRSTCSCRVTCN